MHTFIVKPTMFVSNMYCVQVLEAQRRHQKEKSGIIPTSPTPYTYNKVTFTDFKRIYGPIGMKINNNNLWYMVMLPIIATEVLSHWGSEWVTQELLALNVTW